MTKNKLFYIGALLLLSVTLLFYNNAYKQLDYYTEMTERHHKVLLDFEQLSKLVNNAAIIHPELLKAVSQEKNTTLFFTDSSAILTQLNQLRNLVKDSINIQISNELNRLISAEIDWLIKSNVPDSLIHHQAVMHVAAFSQINTLINKGIQRTTFLITLRRNLVSKEILKVKALMIAFVLVSITLLFYTSIRLLRQQTRTKEKEEELIDYKYALDESSIVAITNQKGIINYVNDNFCKISKYTANELLGQDHRIINSGYHPKEFIKNIWTTIANGNIWKGELKNKAKDGSFYWVDTTIVPFLNEAGKPYQYVAIRSDITERKKAEENLTQSLKEIAGYKYALDESSIVAITDQKGIIQHVNNNFCKISKYTADELIGQDHRIINSGYHPKEFIKKIWTTIANGKIWKGELKNKAKDGSVYWVDTTIVPFLNNAGKPYQYIAIRSDITERKLAEEKLVRSEKIYKTIASSIPGSVICLLDHEYRYLLIEGDMLDKLGYSKEKLVGNKAADVLPIDVFMIAQKNFLQVLDGETITRETHVGGYDIISRYIPLKDENNVVYAIMTVSIDVSELKKAQKHIEELNADLEKKILLRTEELKKSNQEMEAFSYSVSHDLRAPLRSIIGYSTILEEDYAKKLDDEARRLTSIIKSSALKMGQLIDDLLAFSKTGKKVLTKTLINTNALINEVKQELLLNQKNIGITWKINPLPDMHADINTMRQVWINLLSNAVKYSSKVEKPIIEIGSISEGDAITFYIQDNGVGFDEEYKDKLFKVFQRLHDPEEFEGTGVGLALVEKIVTRHGGRVWATGEEDKGATFYFSLPIN